LPGSDIIVIDSRGFAFKDYQMNKFLIAILSLALPLSVIAAEGFSSLEEQMSGKEFTASGLEKLTPEELDALNHWIRNHSVATLDQPKSGSTTVAGGAEVDERGFKNKKDSEEDRSPIATRIKGSFTGWDGHTVFALENGMIWEQADQEKFYTKEVQNPEITITPGLFGTWRLSMVGHNSACRVERVQ
jgi:hypothetical protein